MVSVSSKIDITMMDIISKADSGLEENKRRAFLGQEPLVAISANANADASNTKGRQHNFGLHTFQMCKTAVTLGQFKEFIVTAGRTDLLDGDFMNHNSQGDSAPVVMVSKSHAQEFIDWLNKTDGGGYRLPSSDEWRYACKNEWQYTCTTVPDFHPPITDRLRTIASTLVPVLLLDTSKPVWIGSFRGYCYGTQELSFARVKFRYGDAVLPLNHPGEFVSLQNQETVRVTRDHRLEKHAVESLGRFGLEEISDYGIPEEISDRPIFLLERESFWPSFMQQTIPQMRAAGWEIAISLDSGGIIGITLDMMTTMVWFQDNSKGKIHPVGQKQANCFGLYDMFGNVFEMTDDISVGENRKYLALGGSYKSCMRDMGAPSRYYESNSRSGDMGFRLARTLP